MKLETRQYQNPDSTLVINNPACDFYQCTIYWEPGTQVAVNWANPPTGTVQVDLMTNNNSDVAYNIGTAPATSNTCDAGAGYGNPGPNGATCGGFVFTVPSSWAAGNYSSVRAMNVQDTNLQSYTDKVYITHNSTTPTNVNLSIVSGSTVGGTSTAAGSSSTAAAGSTTASSGSAAATSTGSSSSGSATRTGSSGAASSTGTTNGALSTSGNSGAALSLAAAVFAVGLGSLFL